MSQHRKAESHVYAAALAEPPAWYAPYLIQVLPQRTLIFHQD
jgi:hypothetical protein